MTAQTDTPAAGANGAAPGVPPPGDGAGLLTGELPAHATTGEAIMGLIGIAFAIGLLAIGLDLVTGGAVSRMFGAAPEQDSAGSGG
jgi:hypothetical protein